VKVSVAKVSVVPIKPRMANAVKENAMERKKWKMGNVAKVNAVKVNAVKASVANKPRLFST
jgi:hypothetical protein